jgi:hypothetical protein
MPSIPLENILEAALPGLPPQGRAVINTLVACAGRVGSADGLATSLGLRSRFALARLLARTGLPPLRELADWIRVLQLLWRTEASGTSLERVAHACGMDPRACNRAVRRTTGLSWKGATTRGFSWAFLEFMQRRRLPAA